MSDHDDPSTPQVPTRQSGQEQAPTVRTATTGALPDLFVSLGIPDDAQGAALRALQGSDRVLVISGPDAGVSGDPVSLGDAEGSLLDKGGGLILECTARSEQSSPAAGPADVCPQAPSQERSDLMRVAVDLSAPIAAAQERAANHQQTGAGPSKDPVGPDEDAWFEKEVQQPRHVIGIPDPSVDERGRKTHSIRLTRRQRALMRLAFLAPVGRPFRTAYVFVRRQPPANLGLIGALIAAFALLLVVVFAIKNQNGFRTKRQQMVETAGTPVDRTTDYPLLAEVPALPEFDLALPDLRPADQSSPADLASALLPPDLAPPPPPAVTTVVVPPAADPPCPTPPRRNAAPFNWHEFCNRPNPPPVCSYPAFK